jgi:hypothetical protein
MIVFAGSIANRDWPINNGGVFGQALASGTCNGWKDSVWSAAKACP